MAPTIFTEIDRLTLRVGGCVDVVVVAGRVVVDFSGRESFGSVTPGDATTVVVLSGSVVIGKVSSSEGLDVPGVVSMTSMLGGVAPGDESFAICVKMSTASMPTSTTTVAARARSRDESDVPLAIRWRVTLGVGR